MPSVEVGGWMAMILAAAALVVFVAVEAIRHALRIRMLERLAASAPDESHAPLGAEATSAAAVATVPSRSPMAFPPPRSGASPGSAVDGRP